MACDGARHLPASRRGKVEATWNETTSPVAEWVGPVCGLAVEARARPVEPARGDRKFSWDDRPPGELGAPFSGRPWRPVGTPCGKDSFHRDAHPKGGVAVPAVQVEREIIDGVQLRRRRRMRDGLCHWTACGGGQVGR